MTSLVKYKFSNYSILICGFVAALVCYFFIWNNATIDLISGGDAEYYYYYLQSTFIDASFIKYKWINNPYGMHHHPVGLSLIWMPFFLIAFAYAALANYPMDGLSAPFQCSVSIAAIFYCIIGLMYLKKLFRLNRISDKVTAIIILLIFFGTNLFHYTINESAMSHAYSFCFVTAFMYHACKFVIHQQNKNLIYAALLFGVVLLIRPNNIFIILSIFFWFNSKQQCVTFLQKLFRNKTFYYAILILIGFVLVQLFTWFVKENTLYSNRYAGFGFHWLQPKTLEMLFGFDAGFFIYTPICFLFLFGLISIYQSNKFSFYAIVFFTLILFYFLSSYNAYTYFDGIGLRVLIDFYPVFAYVGAKLFMNLETRKVVYASVLIFSLAFTYISLIYFYQAKKSILLRAGMNYNKWNYVFLKTGKEYQNCLGGSNDLTPYAKNEPKIALANTINFKEPFNFAGKDFGVGIRFDSVGFTSNQIRLRINCSRKEQVLNASKNALVCCVLEDTTGKYKIYSTFKLNETPSTDCCDYKEYTYYNNLLGDFKPKDRLTIHLWNKELQPFLINKFSVQVYNYNYQIN